VRKYHATFAVIPVAVVLHYGLHVSPLIVFAVASLALIPAAYMMSHATEELSARTGPGIGGLVNVTFGNGPELILAFLSLVEGLHEVVKASLVGSILGNILLVLGGAMVVGGWQRPTQRFDRTAVQAYAGVLLMAVIVLLLPTVMQLARGGDLPSVGDVLVDFPARIETASIAVAVVLILGYAAAMVFSLKTHRDVFNPGEGDGDRSSGEDSPQPTPSDGDSPEHSSQAERAPTTRRLITELAIAGVLVGITSELMVGTITQTAAEAKVSEFFLGIVVMAIAGNAAEHWVAVLAAAKDEMHLTLTITLGSSAQIALVVAPVLVLLSLFLAHPLALVFNAYEIAGLLFAVLIANYLTLEGESNWFEGVQLLALYTALVIIFLLA
jgi:Ca2+:H+ antiporter